MNRGFGGAQSMGGSLEQLQETLWQITMLGDQLRLPMRDMIGGINAVVQGLAAFKAALAFAATDLKKLSPKSLGESIMQSGKALRQTGKKMGGVTEDILGSVGKSLSRFGKGLSKLTPGWGAAIYAGVGAGLLGLKEASVAYSQKVEASRKRFLEESGFLSDKLGLAMKQAYELSTQTAKNFIALDQKRAENALSLFRMKSQSVGMELEYQKKIFAIDEDRLRVAQQIEMLQTKGRHGEQRIELSLERMRRLGEAQSAAQITRPWLWADYAKDEYGNKIDKSVLREAGAANPFEPKSRTDADFRALLQIGHSIRKAIIDGFSESLKETQAVNAALLEKMKALSAAGVSDSLVKKVEDFQTRQANLKQKQTDNMFALAYDRLMTVSLTTAMEEGLVKRTPEGNFTYYDSTGNQVVTSNFDWDVIRYRYQTGLKKGKYSHITELKNEERELVGEGYYLDALAEMQGRTSLVSQERLQKTLETRKKIAEQQREKYVSHASETIGMYDSSAGSLERLRLKRSAEAAQEQILLQVQDDAVLTQRYKERFAEENAVRDAQDKAASKFGDEQRELINRIRLEAAKRELASSREYADQMRRASETMLKASLGIRESQADLARKISRFQLDVELAQSDTYGKTIWETQKAILNADADAQNAANRSAIEQKYMAIKAKDDNALDLEKTDELAKMRTRHLDEQHQTQERHLKERAELEKQLIRDQLEYRKAEIRYEYEYRAKLDEIYNKERLSKQKVLLGYATEKDVEDAFGEGTKMEDLTDDQKEKLAGIVKAKVEDYQPFVDEWTSKMGVGADKLGEKLQEESKKASSALSVKEDLGGLTNDIINQALDENRKRPAHIRNKDHDFTRNRIHELVRERLGEYYSYNEDTGLIEFDESRVPEMNKLLAANETYQDMLSRGVDYSAVSKAIKESEEASAKNIAKEIETATEEVYKSSGLADMVSKREAGAERKASLSYTQSSQEAIEEAGREEEIAKAEARFSEKAAMRESARNIERENALAQEDIAHQRAKAYGNIELDYGARRDKFLAEQSNIYNQGQITQQTLAVDTLVSAMQQGGGGYTNTMMKYGIQSEYESIKNDMAARHRAETEWLESRGNVTEYERQELKNRQESESVNLDNQKKLRDMMADRIMSDKVGQKSGLVETWERIQTAAFGHTKDPVELAIDSLKDNQSHHHDDLMSRLDQYLPAIADNTAETDRRAVTNVSNYISPNPGLASGMPYTLN